MSQDAQFEDGGESPLYLGAFDKEDLKVISAMVQDAVLPITEISWRPRQRRLGLLINRFRWEDKDKAIAQGRTFERVQSLLLVENVISMSSQGIDRKQNDLILSLLSLDMQEAENGDVHLAITCAGDGAIKVRTEAIEVSLKDVTCTYQAQSSKPPKHPE
jgi:hypothetical protein